jgi:3D (Asp-Asp-Asp) domain-containing protein
MNTLLLATVLISSMQVTSYRSVKNQTDSSPNWSSIGVHTNPMMLAVSQDLLKKNGGTLSYGDTVYVEDIGFKVVQDCMNKMYKNRADVWVSTYEEEKAFDKKFSHRKLKVWLIKKKEEQKENTGPIKRELIQKMRPLR